MLPIISTTIIIMAIIFVIIPGTNHFCVNAVTAVSITSTTAAMMQYLTGTTLIFIKRSINTTDTVSIIILIDSPVYFNIFFIHTFFLKSKKDDTFDLCAAIISITNYYPHVHSTCHNICHSTYHNKNFLPYQLY